MNWPYKSTVSFIDASGTRLRVRYVVSASCIAAARDQIERLLLGHGLSDLIVEDVDPVTAEEQRRLDLPAGRLQPFN
jgi:hypothetical protein